MITRFQDMLMRTLIESKDFMPVRDEEGNLNILDKFNILTKNSYGSNIIVELLDCDSFTRDEIIERLQQNKKMLKDLKRSENCFFFEIFIFSSDPDNGTLEAINQNQFQKVMGKKYLKCISVDLSKNSVYRHFKAPVSDMGLSKTISKILADGMREDIELPDINEVISKKEKDYEVELRAKSPIITYTLIAVNIIVSILLFFYSSKSGISYNQLLIDFGAKVNSLILAGEYWRFIAPIFLHADATHLLVNCYSLYAVGVNVERLFGRLRFIVIYLLAGILGNVASFAFSANPAIGASGAIFGLLGTLLYFGLKKPALFRATFGYGVIATIFINVAYGFSRSGIDNFAHLGGLVGGFLITGIVNESDRSHWFLNRYIYILVAVIVSFTGVFYGFTNKQNTIIRGVSELEQLDKAKDWSKAEVKAEHVLKLQPSDTSTRASVLWTLVKSEALTGKNNEAIDHAKLLIQIDPADGHYILGAIYFDMKEFPLSKKELLAAKEAGAKYEQIDSMLKEIK